ncbi:MAG: competence/damage-inducible protein A [Bacteroidetes bacterium]|nr:competence/damage-inducible protein A [Bacteroidota bacterium]
MQTEIINIGDELLIGQVVNTNASWMSEQLDLAGFPVHRVTLIRDDPEEILTILKEAGQRAEVILITGGLGPTKDDLTKETLCRYFNTKLIFDPVSFQNIEKMFHARGFAMTEVNRKQAEIPENCIAIANANGTAPGMWFEITKTRAGTKQIYISMPGVPFEMKAMLVNEVIPRLKKCFQPVTVLHHTLLTQGIGESFLSDILEEWEAHLPENLHLAYLPQPGIVRLRLTGKGDNEVSLQKLMDEETDKLKSLIPEYIFGEGDTTLEAVVGNLLRNSGTTLATAESCTGGYIAHLITSIPGSSAYYKGSIVAYSNEIKIKELGVSERVLEKEGAVSEAVVITMASTVRNGFGTDYSIAVSGISGPDGGTEEKPVGTVWIAVAGPSGVKAVKYLFGDNRERNIRRTALQALNMLRKTILEQL